MMYHGFMIYKTLEQLGDELEESSQRISKLNNLGEYYRGKQAIVTCKLRNIMKANQVKQYFPLFCSKLCDE